MCTQKQRGLRNQEDAENPSSSSSANTRPQRLSRGDESSSGIAAPHPILSLLSAEQRNYFDHHAREDRKPPNPPAQEVLKPGAPQFSIASVRRADLHSERKQALPGRGAVQQGMESLTQRAEPPGMSMMLGEQDHSLQVTPSQPRGGFYVSQTWASAAWAEPLGLSPPCSGHSSLGEV